MAYTIEQKVDTKVVRFDGDLSGSKEQELRRLFVELRKDESVPRVVADMTQVSFLDSAVLGTLVWGMKNLREAGGDFRMFGLQEFVKDIFAITQLNQAFRIYASESEALASY
jgi:anti-sigma B factor antagonist